MTTIPIAFINSSESESDTLGLFTPKTVIKNVDVEKIRESLSDLSGQISGLVKDLKSSGDIRLKEIQVGVEISAEGGVSLIGSAQVGAKAAITLTFSV